MKFYGGLLCCFLLIGTGFPVHCQHDLHDQGYGLPSEDYVYDEVDESLAVDGGVVSDPPRFTAQPQRLTPLIGETANFPCSSDNTKSEVLMIESYSMTNPKGKIVIIAGEMFLNKDPRYSMDQANSIFTIKDIKKSDSAYIICVYQYQGERISLNHTLDVYYPPTIRPKMKTEEVLEGETVILFCKATGNPKPTISWTTIDGHEQIDQRVGTNITLENADRHISGSYECTANNGVGNAATARREIVVFYAPDIRTNEKMIHTGTGASAELVCTVHAHPTAEVTWTHNGLPVDTDTRAEVFDGGHRHLLTIEVVTAQDFGVYRCNADNKYGNDTTKINLTDSPSKPRVTTVPHSAAETSYTLAWSTKSYYPITSYELQYRKTKANETSDEPGEWHIIAQEIKEDDQQSEGTSRTFQHTIDELERATDYEAILTIANTAKPAEEVNFTFSTRKALPPTSSNQPIPEVINESAPDNVQETNDMHTTASVAGRSVASLAVQSLLPLLVLTVALS